MVSGAMSVSLFLGLLPLAGEPAPPQRPKVAVLFFENRTGDPGLEHWSYTSRLLIFDGLRNFPAIHALERNAVEYAFFRLGIKAGSPITTHQAREAGEILDADWVVSGEFRREAELWAITIRLLKIQGEKPPQEIQAANGDLFTLRDGLVRGILKSLGVDPTEGRHSKRWTVSSEALESICRFYNADFKLEADAVLEKYLRDATGKDPTSCRAHALLALILKRQGKVEEAEKEHLHGSRLAGLHG